MVQQIKDQLEEDETKQSSEITYRGRRWLLTIANSFWSHSQTAAR